MSRSAMLIDTSKCMACRGCQVACKQWNDLEGLSPSTSASRGSYENPGDRSPNTWTRIRFVEYEGGGRFQWLFLKEGCMHCQEAACVEVCSTGALKHAANGSVTFQEELCNGCGYCRTFCPFDTPRLQVTNTLSGAAKSSKCTFCQDRTSNGLLPACVKTCPSGALDWGDRDGILAKAQARVEQLRSELGFTQANLYGANELGGLGRLYVLTAPPEAYGLPANPVYPTLAIAWQRVLQPLGHLAFGAAMLGIVGAFAVARRHIKMEEVQ